MISSRGTPMVSVSNARSRGNGEPTMARICQARTRASTSTPTTSTTIPVPAGRRSGSTKYPTNMTVAVSTERSTRTVAILVRCRLVRSSYRVGVRMPRRWHRAGRSGNLRTGGSVIGPGCRGAAVGGQRLLRPPGDPVGHLRPIAHDGVAAQGQHQAGEPFVVARVQGDPHPGLRVGQRGNRLDRVVLGHPAGAAGEDELDGWHRRVGMED